MVHKVRWEAWDDVWLLPQDGSLSSCVLVVRADAHVFRDTCSCWVVVVAVVVPTQRPDDREEVLELDTWDRPRAVDKIPVAVVDSNLPQGKHAVHRA